MNNFENIAFIAIGILIIIFREKGAKDSARYLIGGTDKQKVQASKIAMVAAGIGFIVLSTLELLGI